MVYLMKRGGETLEDVVHKSKCNCWSG